MVWTDETVEEPLQESPVEENVPASVEEPEEVVEPVNETNDNVVPENTFEEPAEIDNDFNIK